MEERYKAAMVLAGAGDALGYKDGEWEFCHSGTAILDQLKKLGGLENVKVKKRGWPVSDDTVMHLATAEALVLRSGDPNKEQMFSLIARFYKDCMRDMAGRAPGATCMSMTHKLRPDVKGGYKIPFNPRGVGNGASMRAMCIGLRFPRPEELKKLVAVSIESGRMTHHHPTGYLGALASALFTAYAIQGKDPTEWASGLLHVVDREAREYIIQSKHCTRENLHDLAYFVSAWEQYIELRKLRTGKVEFPENYNDPLVRDQFYKEISFGGCGGASGHDSTIIAYDAILGAGQSWEELCKRGMFHGGDSDSTGTIAACCFGAMYGFTGVPPNNYKNLEYRDRIEGIAKELYWLAEADKLISKPEGACNPQGTDINQPLSDGPKPSLEATSSSKNSDPPQPPPEAPEGQEVQNQSSNTQTEGKEPVESPQGTEKVGASQAAEVPGSYKMDRNPRGLCLIFNIEKFHTNSEDPGSTDLPNREGSSVDADNLKNTFKELNFIIHLKENLISSEIFQSIVQAAMHVDHANYDCFVCCILSHGTKGQVYGSDGTLVNISDLTWPLKSVACPSLAGKPKLFFIQACQGQQQQPGFEMEADGLTLDQKEIPKEVIPNEADFLIGYSTVPGFVSYRSKSHGSWYIIKLCEMLNKYGTKYDLLHVMLEINNEVGRANAKIGGGCYKQSPAPLFTLRKKVIFS